MPFKLDGRFANLSVLSFPACPRMLEVFCRSLLPFLLNANLITSTIIMPVFLDIYVKEIHHSLLTLTRPYHLR